MGVQSWSGFPTLFTTELSKLSKSLDSASEIVTWGNAAVPKLESRSESVQREIFRAASMLRWHRCGATLVPWLFFQSISRTEAGPILES